MIWFTWRQFRTPAWITGGALVAVAVLLAVTGHNLTGQWSASGAAACHHHCSSAVELFMRQVETSGSWAVYRATTILLYVLPALIGMFWGAPLIARELEAGTHRLVWNQSVTPTRWLCTKLAVVGGSSAAVTGLLSWAITVWSHHIDHAKYYRITPVVYGARGIVPIGYALFAFALGVTLGMLIRRTVPAMIATLAVYIGAVASMPLWIRAHLAPASHTTTPLDLSTVREFMIGPHHGMQVVSGVTPRHAWILSNETVTSAGKVFTGPADPQFCGPDQGPRACMHWVGSLNLRQSLTYQPASHFWSLQWTETGIFVAVAVLLTAFCFWRVRRHLT